MLTKTNLAMKPGVNVLDGVEGDLFDLECRMDLGSKGNPVIELNVRGKELKYSRELLLRETGKSAVGMRVLIDRSSIEIFFDEGQYCETHAYLPVKDNRKLTLQVQGEDTRLNSLAIYPVKSVWPAAGVRGLLPAMTDAEASQKTKENRSKNGFYEKK